MISKYTGEFMNILGPFQFLLLLSEAFRFALMPEMILADFSVFGQNLDLPWKQSRQ